MHFVHTHVCILLTEIVDTGSSGALAIGLVPHRYPDNMQPGWSNKSIGYHADDGGYSLLKHCSSVSNRPALPWVGLISL